MHKYLLKRIYCMLYSVLYSVHTNKLQVSIDTSTINVFVCTYRVYLISYR